MKELIKTVGGVQIFHEAGKFKAKIGKYQFTRESVKALEKLINAKAESVEVTLVRSYPDHPHKPETVSIIGMRGDRGILITGKKLDYIDYLYHASPEQIAALKAMVKEQEDLIKRWERALRKIPRVSEDNFLKILAKAGKYTP